MSIPSGCGPGLTFEEITPFTLGYFDIDTGDFIVDGGILKYQGSGSGGPPSEFLIKNGLPNGEYEITVACRLRSQFAYGASSTIAIEALVAVEPYTGSPPVTIDTTANLRAGVTRSSGFMGRVASISHSVNDTNSYPINLLDSVEYTATYTFTIGAADINGDRDLTARIQIPALALDISRTQTDLVLSGYLISLQIGGMVSAYSAGLNTFEIDNIEIVGLGLPVSCPIINSCSPGLSYYKDDCDGPGVNPDWTIEQVLGQPAIVQNAGRYEHTAAFDTVIALRTISQILAGTPSIIDADLTVQINYNTTSFGSTSIAAIVGLGTLGVPFKYALHFENLGFPVVNTKVWLRVFSGFSFVFQEVLFSDSRNYLTFPFNTVVSGKLRIKQISGNNVEVYWDGVLKFTTTDGLNALTTDAAVGLARLNYGAGDDHYGTVDNIEYVGTGLPSACPSGLDAPVLLLPPDDSTGVFTGPLLTWEPVIGATSYEVDIASDSLFSSIVYSASGIIGTSHQGPGGTLDEATEYFWRARANDD